MDLLFAGVLMDKEIFKIIKYTTRAKDIIRYAKDRVNLIKRYYEEERRYKVVEEAYESIKESLTSIMFIDGYKTLSHVKLIEYFNETYKILSSSEMRLLNTLRKARHGIVYYGEKVTQDFLDNNYQEISKIVNKLIKFAEDKLK